MDVLKVSQLINKRIQAIREIRELLPGKSRARAEANSSYEKALAKTIIQLRNGVEFDLEGAKIQNPPATLTRDIAKGICHIDSFKKEHTDTDYKAAIVTIDSLAKEMNGYQSVGRHLDEL